MKRSYSYSLVKVIKRGKSRLDYESVKYVEGFVENIIFRNEDNGYTVFEIEYKGDDITCVGTLSSVDTGEFIAADGVLLSIHHIIQCSLR